MRKLRIPCCRDGDGVMLMISRLEAELLGELGGMKWKVLNDFLAKKKQLSFYEGLRPIAASIKEGLPVLRSTVVQWLLTSTIICIFIKLTESNGNKKVTAQ